MKKQIKTIALVATGLVVGVVVERLKKEKTKKYTWSKTTCTTEEEGLKNLLNYVNQNNLEYINHCFNGNELVMIHTK